MKRLQILAAAYACDPTKGSESGVGWGWVTAMAAEHDITVLTADYNKSNIEEYRRQNQTSLSSNPRFIYVRNRPWHYRPSGMWPAIENSIAKPLMNIAYQDWLNCAFKDAQDEICKSRYDLLHLITYVGWRFPGTFYRLGIPFVWGPIGGMRNTQWRLLPILGFKGAVYYGARNLINSLQLILLRGPRRALLAADKGVIAATSEIQEELRSRFNVESSVICEVGPPHFNTHSPTPRGDGELLRICWSGQHLPGKALPLLLRAAARLTKDFEYTIEILGDGPCNRSWRSLASKLNIAQRCHWHGWLPRDQSLSVMKESHVFVITSLKDLTSTVAVEALSLGLPIVSLDHCGFKDLVNEECGIKVRPGSAEQIVSDIAGALSALYTNESLRLRLAEGAIRRSQVYSWQAKMEALNDIYSRAVATNELDTADEPHIDDSTSD
ncbi:MAG TPA: glycosyltransferase, partial [Terracidiphilus sp.]|nr:glycosyltransferase [Terracidiphilus sp.]